MEQMEFEEAPRDHLQTWGHVKYIIVWSCIGIAALLLIMAATLTP